MDEILTATPADDPYDNDGPLIGITIVALLTWLTGASVVSELVSGYEPFVWVGSGLLAAGVVAVSFRRVAANSRRRAQQSFGRACEWLADTGRLSNAQLLDVVAGVREQTHDSFSRWVGIVRSIETVIGEERARRLIEGIVTSDNYGLVYDLDRIYVDRHTNGWAIDFDGRDVLPYVVVDLVAAATFTGEAARASARHHLSVDHRPTANA